jgi:hypothetical protein
LDICSETEGQTPVRTLLNSRAVATAEVFQFEETQK